MGNHNIMLLIFFCVSFTVIVPAVLAGEANEHLGFAEVDNFVQQRARNASRIAMESYVQNPEKMTQIFNKEVIEHLVGTNGTRRHLKDSGDCHATNPIDRCWRCDANWYNNRKKLADCARGFGHKATGGKDGRYYVVTESSDDDVVNPKPGTLRHAVIQEEPLWIVFSKSMVITLKQELIMAGDKTIDGRGVNVHIAYGAGITIQFVNNVIIHGIRIHDIIVTSGGIIRDSILHLGLRTVSDGDGISLFGATNVWIDHVSLAKCSDGLIDAIMASTAITISNCKLNHHNDVILLGANDGYQGDQIMQVTVAFNRFGKGCIQRMPRCRWGFFHVVNNDYNKWEMYAIGGSQHPTIISQGNRFRADDNPNTKEITHRDYFPEFIWRNWQWRSEGDLYLNGAYFRESGPELAEDLDLHENMVNAKPGSFAGRLTRYAGALKCKPGKPC